MRDSVIVLVIVTSLESDIGRALGGCGLGVGWGVRCGCCDSVMGGLAVLVVGLVVMLVVVSGC